MKRNYWLWTVIIILVFIFSVVAGYFMGVKGAQNIDINNDSEYLQETEDVSKSEEKIYPYTELNYEYYYPYENATETEKCLAPEFMVGLTLEDLNEYYSDWQVTYFSSEKVVMRKTIYSERNQRYIVGERDGYIIVYYEEDIDGKIVKEHTNIPVAALPNDERKRLQEGIKVIGEDSLMSILQDFGS